jgi:hypothetical protein
MTETTMLQPSTVDLCSYCATPTPTPKACREAASRLAPLIILQCQVLKVHQATSVLRPMKIFLLFLVPLLLTYIPRTLLGLVVAR